MIVQLPSPSNGVAKTREIIDHIKRSDRKRNNSFCCISEIYAFNLV